MERAICRKKEHGKTCRIYGQRCAAAVIQDSYQLRKAFFHNQIPLFCMIGFHIQYKGILHLIVRLTDGKSIYPNRLWSKANKASLISKML